MSKFKVGDRVRIRPGSSYYGQHPDFNPSDQVGIVTKIVCTVRLSILVHWPRGKNTYRERDLEHDETLLLELGTD